MYWRPVVKKKFEAVDEANEDLLGWKLRDIEPSRPAVEMRPFTGTEEEWRRKPLNWGFLPPNMESLISAERPGSPGWAAKKLAGPLPEMAKAAKETRWGDLFNLYSEASAPAEGNVKILGQDIPKQALLDALFFSVGMTGNLGGKVPKVPKGKVPKGKVPKQPKKVLPSEYIKQIKEESPDALTAKENISP